MFKKIAVAYNDFPESHRALASAIQLAKTLGAELQAITNMQDLPAYTDYAAAADSSPEQVLLENWRDHAERLHAEARAIALSNGVELVSYLVEGGAIRTIIDFVLHHQNDLLVIGLPRRGLRISCLWSTVYEVAQDVSCSVLGVH